MELDNKKQTLIKAYKALERSINKHLNPPEYADSEDIDSYMTTVIARFNLTYECLWKFLKMYLEAAGIESKGSKDAIRKCQDAGILTSEETIIMFVILDSRNLLTHVYDEVNAQNLTTIIIKDFTPALQSIITKISTIP